jgi:hypothetical protein
LITSLLVNEVASKVRESTQNRLVLASQKDPASASAILHLYPEETRAINAAYHQRIRRNQASLIPLDPQAFPIWTITNAGY